LRPSRAGGSVAIVSGQGGDPATAQTLYQEAIQLNDGGCRLQEGDEWRAVEGLALAMMLQGNYAGAMPWLQRANTRWPTITETIYNMACGYCQTGNVEMCYQTFVRALQNATATRPPAFITDPGTVGHYVTISQSDSDLAPLRVDPRYQAAIAPYAGQP
jgi:hypothetical protein